jgi:hypothetical protein
MSKENMLIGDLSETDDKRVSIKDILNFVFESPNIEQKTILSAENIDALIKMKATNVYLKKYYNLEIELYKTIIDEKRVNIISHKGRGRDDILKSVQAMQNPIIQNEEKRGIF